MAIKLQHRLGVTRLFNLGIGTTGYWNNGSNNRRRQVDQITHDWGRAGAPWAAPDLVVFANGYNDFSGSSTNATISNQTGITAGTTVPQAIATYATQAWAAARALYPNALFVILGGFGGKNGPSADTLAGEAAVKAAWQAWGDDFSVYIPINADPTVTGFEPYQSGTGYVGSTTGSGNSDLTTSGDGTHPSDYGHDLIAKRLTGDIVRAIAQLSTSTAA